MDHDRARTQEMRGAEQQGDMMERRNALFGDRRVILVDGLADIEIQGLGKTDAAIAFGLGNLLGETT